MNLVTRNTVNVRMGSIKAEVSPDYYDQTIKNRNSWFLASLALQDGLTASSRL